MDEYEWIGLEVALPSKISELDLQHMGFFWKETCKKKRVGGVACSGPLCLERNEVIFNNGELQMGRVLEMIKYRSWSWLARK